MTLKNNIYRDITEHINQPYDLGSCKLKGCYKNDPIFHRSNEFEDQGENHDVVQIFYPHEDIINTQVKFISASRNEK